MIPISNKLSKVYLISFIVFSLIALYFLFHIGYWYWSNRQADSIVEKLQEGVIIETSSEEVKEVIDIAESDQEVEEKEEEPVFQYPFVSVDFEELKEVNPDIVSWLRIEGLGVDMPIVQTTDNEFYLDHGLDRKPNKIGWVFADVRSNIEHLGLNTVLYGHNVTRERMFGVLKNLLKVTEEEKSDYQYISFTTERKQMVFEIVSVYVTHYEDWKYVRQVFPDLESKQEFVNDVIERNTVKIFENKDITPMDNILTFSTCYGPAGTSNRLVVHSKLVAVQDV